MSQARFTKDNAPLVVIVTPVYNGADYLEECLESVQAQTWPNTVHLVLDNASTDETPAILERYKTNTRVPVIVHRNPALLPMGENWNRAGELVPADAAFVRFLCHDDTITRTSTADMAEIMVRHRQVTVAGGTRYVNERFWDCPLPDDQEVFPGREIARKYILYQVRSIVPNLILMRWEAVKDRKPLFDISLTTFDGAIFFDLLAMGDFGYTPDPIGMTREHAASSTSTNLGRLRIDMIEYYDDLDRYGPRFFSADELGVLRADFVQRWRRKYLVWALSPGDRERYRLHKQALAERGLTPGWREFLSAYGELFRRRFMDVVTGRGRSGPLVEW